MKFSFLMVLLILFSCRPDQEKTDTQVIQIGNEKTPETLPVDSSMLKTEALGTCYEQKFGPIGKENIFRVNLIEKEKEVTGLLEYIFYGEQPIAGTIIGKAQENGEIQVLYSYVQDGMPQYQKVYFKKTGNFLLQKSGELVETKGILDLKDKSAPYTDTFKQVPCSKSFL